MDIIAKDEAEFKWSDMSPTENSLDNGDEEMEGGEPDMDEGEREQLPQEEDDLEAIDQELALKQFIGGEVPSKQDSELYFKLRKGAIEDKYLNIRAWF